MINRAIRETENRTKALGNESVHGLPQKWPELKRKTIPARQNRRDASLATQNVHGLPTTWVELDLSE